MGSLGSGWEFGIRMGVGDQGFGISMGVWDQGGEFGIGLEAGICHRWIFGIAPPCFSARGSPAFPASFSIGN